MSPPHSSPPVHGPAPDTLEEYGGDYRMFEPLDPRTTEAIIRRRQTEPSSSGAAQPEESASPSCDTAVPASPRASAGPVRLTSRGRTLIVGRDPATVEAWGRYLARHQPCLMLVEETAAPGAPNDADPADEDRFNGLLRGRDVRIRGGLGRFKVSTRAGDRRLPLEHAFAGLPDHFDLVLDLRPQPPEERILPPGYFAPGGDPDALETILDELPRMVGVFSKPRFVRPDPASCAGPRACGRCLETCPTAALGNAAGIVSVDHAACPGCGLCTVVCPTGSLQYRQPSPQDLLAVVHSRLADARLAAGAAANVIFRQGSPEGRPPEPVAATPAPPELVFPLQAVGSVGPEVWLGALAFGARRVVVELPPLCPAPVRQVLTGQHAWIAALLSALGHDGRLLLCESGSPAEHRTDADRDAVASADFLPFQSKRELIRESVSLLAAGRSDATAVALPEGTPFGAVVLDPGACTLCMACSGACPTGALTATGAAPQLSLRESECIQCGRCRDVCPEKALRLEPRLQWHPDESAEPRPLYAQAPMACIRCGAPFGPAALVKRMLQRLENHWMYRREEDRLRLQMCRDCRVRDLFARPLPKEEP